jgi:hypothetical protein
MILVTSEILEKQRAWRAAEISDTIQISGRMGILGISQKMLLFMKNQYRVHLIPFGSHSD